MKKAIYTVITGGYDQLVSPPFIDQDCDYLCFTDSEDMQVPEPWQLITLLDHNFRFMIDVYKQRLVKIKGYYPLEEYDIVLYHDGYLHQIASVQPLFDQFEKSKPDLLIMKHPDRDCIYDEIEACRQLRKADSDDLLDQYKAYKSDNIPEKAGMIASGVMVRSFNENYRVFAKKWFNELTFTTHRDQIAFAAVEQRQCIEKEIVPWNDVIGKLFNKVPHKITKTYK